jgi:hypothetical protein
MDKLCEPLYTLYMAFSTFLNVFSDSLVDVRTEVSEELVIQSDEVEFKLHPYSIFVTIKEASISSGLDLVFSALYPGPAIFVKGGSNILVNLYQDDLGAELPNALHHVIRIQNHSRFAWRFERVPSI